MKISYNWLKTYFTSDIPSPEKLVDLFTFHFSEVEGVEKIGENTIFDIKILPDRAHYALSHKGVAEEVSALTRIPINKDRIPKPPEVNSGEKIKVEVKDENFCRRYISCVVKGVDNTQVQEGVKIMLEGIGQRSISPIVDATNMVMFDIGQPMHAFDADKVEGDIVVRAANAGEEIILLDDRKVTLTPDDFVIADNIGPLAIAGVKGGKRAQVTPETKNIIIESANFHPTRVRRTSTKNDLRSESSKRFENEITPELAMPAMANILAFMKELSPEAKFGPIVDVYPTKSTQTAFTINPASISKKIGIEIPEKDIIEILELQGIKNDNWKLTIPFERFDLTMPEDIAEEVGRIYGYDKLPTNLPKESTFKPQVESAFYYSEKIKNFLVEKGFSEVYTYSLVDKGVYEVEKPLAADKNFLRPNLTQGIVKALDLNSRNADLLGLTEDVKVFEVGKVFCDEGEHTALSIGIKNIKKKQEKEKEKVKTIRDELLNSLGAKFTIVCPVDHSGGIITVNNKTIGITNNTEGIMELNLDALVDSLPTPASYDDLNLGKAISTEYKKFSIFPFIVRDIALFVSSETKVDEVSNVIEKAAKTEILTKGPDLFDEFEKEGKKSLAFRLIFQAADRTLSDEEVNKIMEKVYESVKEKGWQVR